MSTAPNEPDFWEKGLKFFRGEWKYQTEENPLIPKPGMGCALTILMIVVYAWFGSVASSFYDGRFKREYAEGATANAAEAIRDWVIFRPADMLIAGLLFLILWRLGDLYYLLKPPPK